MRGDWGQLNEELNKSFTALAGMHALSMVVLYQQMAAELDLGNIWAASRIRELSATAARNAPGSVKPRFLATYADELAKYAKQIESFDGPESPQLTLIKGGADKSVDNDDEEAK